MPPVMRIIDAADVIDETFFTGPRPPTWQQLADLIRRQSPELVNEADAGWELADSEPKRSARPGIPISIGKISP